MKVKDLRDQLDGLDDDLEIYELAKYDKEVINKTNKNTIFGFISKLDNRSSHFSLEETEIRKHKVLILI